MIPIHLTIDGLYSYQTRQSIDFSQLTDAGLFGVFGAVGSGKSSILEAITFALYGNSDRLGSKDFAYNMMNLKSNRMWLEFEFLNFENKTFKITREYRRNSKRFENITNVGVMLYEKVNGEWIPQDSANVEPIIGLSSENFRRTIIIPQGQFRDFIELKPTERTQMMKEIFGLQKFDLHDKASQLASQNTAQLQLLEGQLKGFEMVSEEEITTLKERQKEANSILVDKQTIFNEANERFNRLKNLKAELQEWKNKQEELARLQSQEDEFKSMEQELIQFERIQSTFLALLEEQKRVNTELVSKQNALVSKQEEAQASIELEKQLSAELADLKPKKEALESLKVQLKELDLIKRIKLAKQVVKENEASLLKGNAFIEDQKKLAEDTQTLILQLEKDIATLVQQQMLTVDLVDLESWYKTHSDLQQRVVALEAKLHEQHKNKPSLSSFIEPFGLHMDHLEDQLLTQTAKIAEERKQLEANRNALEVKRQLSQYAHSLMDGHECPLCGSLEHPKVAEMEDVTTQMDAVLQNLHRNQEDENKWKKIISEIEKKEQEILIFNNRLQEEEALLKIEQAKLVANRASFRWENFSPDDMSTFVVKKQQHFENESKKEELDDRLKIKRQELLNLQQNIERAKTKILDLQNKSDLAAGESQTLLGMLQHLNYNSFEERSDIELEQQLNEWEKTIVQTESTYERTEKQWNDIQLKISAEQASIKEMQFHFEELTARQIKLSEELTTRLEKENIPAITDVEVILSKNLNVAAVRARVEQFRVQFLTVKEVVAAFEKKLADVNLEEEAFQREEESFRLAEEALKLATQESAKLDDQLKRLEQLFEEKRGMLDVFEKLKKRAENLAEMLKLFKAAGFVQYVASIYLKQLCAHANHRFHRMTRNQLSLQLGENGFEIIDYLNEGKSRSVKTLSGGQAFQVSLCLALALAESVQANSKANRNFFFIDEGFGTQDSESVNIVFETLQSLQKENRIVGIISHVDELKERMPISIQVEKDTEKGSLIEIIN